MNLAVNEVSSGLGQCAFALLIAALFWTGHTLLSKRGGKASQSFRSWLGLTSPESTWRARC